MKSLIITLLLLVGSIVHGQDLAPEGSYTIECNEKQEKISLSEDTKILIEDKRQSEQETRIKVGDFTIRIMSEEKLSEGIRWAKYTIVSNEK